MNHHRREWATSSTASAVVAGQRSIRMPILRQTVFKHSELAHDVCVCKEYLLLFHIGWALHFAHCLYPRSNCLAGVHKPIPKPLSGANASRVGKLVNGEGIQGRRKSFERPRFIGYERIVHKSIGLFHHLKGWPFLVPIIGKPLSQLPNFCTSHLANGDEIFKTVRVCIHRRHVLKRSLSTHLLTRKLPCPSNGSDCAHRLNPTGHQAGVIALRSQRCCTGQSDCEQSDKTNHPAKKNSCTAHSGPHCHFL